MSFFLFFPLSSIRINRRCNMPRQNNDRIRQHNTDRIRQYNTDRIRQHNTDRIRQHMTDSIRHHNSPTKTLPLPIHPPHHPVSLPPSLCLLLLLFVWRVAEVRMQVLSVSDNTWKNRKRKQVALVPRRWVLVVPPSSLPPLSLGLPGCRTPM